MKQPKSNQQSRPINTRADDTANEVDPFAVELGGGLLLNYMVML